MANAFPFPLRTAVAREQRHLRRHPCPVCKGFDEAPRGQEKRCHGFTSEDEMWCHCAREELSGGIVQGSDGLFAHKMLGPCKCGITHREDNRPRREIETTYDYVDEQGNFLFQVVRYVGKDFRQRTKDANGEWVWGLNGARRVLYHLDDLVSDDMDRTVYIAEGEKDVDRLRRDGVLSTCNPMGAGKWGAVADLARIVLQGRDVVVIADRDEPGRKHATETEAGLRSVVRSLRVLEPPSPHKDVSDLLAAGGSLEQLQPLDSGDGPTEAEPLRGLTHLSKLAVLGRDKILELAARPVRYLWEQIAVAGTIILLAAGPGEGKTTLLFLLLAARLNTGAPVRLLGRQVEPAPPNSYTVVIEGEHSESSACRKLLRSLALLKIDESSLDRLILVARKAVRLGSPEWLDVVTLVRSGLVSDIAIDTVARVAPGEADSEREQTAIFDLVAQAIEAAPTEASKPTVWACAHTRKNNRSGDVSDVSGSTQRVGQADSVLMLTGEKIEGRTVASKVTFGKLREEPDEYPLPVTFSIDGDDVRTSASLNDEDGRPLEERIVEQLQSGAKTKTALARVLRRSDKDMENAISSLFANSAITTTYVTVRGKQQRAFALRKQ
jgi:hypothetical protein